MKTPSQVLWLIVICAALGFSGTAEAGSKTGSVRSVGNAVLPLFRNGEDAPYAIVRLKSMRPDFERKGFLKIALLRQTVVEGLQIEVGRAEDALAALNEFPKAIPNFPRDGFSLKNFSITVRGKGEPLLHAEAAKASRVAGFLNLLSVRLAARPQEMMQSAGLRLTGPSAGELVLASETIFPFRTKVKP
jgi:hypothetical protein